MKKLALILAFSFVGMFAHADTTDLQTNQDEVSAAGRTWVCGLAFKGTSKGLKIIVGHFKTVAYGHLKCKGLLGKTYSQRVMVSIGHHWIGPTAGIGYFKMAGVSSEISLFNKHPEAILGKYLVAQGEAAIIGGVGAFTAVKVGVPQIAANVSLQLLKGFGVQVGIDGLHISAY
ncbi:hypothetical protein [Bdellovibrio reynosensis]|uniref:DUF992 domain-containing protein n=1 Tax=Bdellovibrio reynosensis TaxID=2835041 RepID=A0ABY4C9V4_9BACT|nr:hypothetical protein [Bdellovibrio reynosensis]UOF01259.1 hypothetical protein MNR06_16310 [Bdellovibrio reynosensis]